jgi:hypothetical protein
MVHQIVYASSPVGSLLPADIETILEQARHNNQKRGVTGFLLFDGSQFLQLLEGDKRDVEEAFEIIRKDPRHRDVEPMLSQDDAPQSFSSWSMAYATTAPGAIRKFGGSMSSSGARDMVGYFKNSKSDMGGLIAEFLSGLLDG